MQRMGLLHKNILHLKTCISTGLTVAISESKEIHTHINTHTHAQKVLRLVSADKLYKYTFIF